MAASSGGDTDMADAASAPDTPEEDAYGHGDWVEVIRGLRGLASLLPTKAKTAVALDCAARPDAAAHTREDAVALFEAVAAGASPEQLRHSAAAEAHAPPHAQAAPQPGSGPLPPIPWVSPKAAALSQRLRESGPPSSSAAAAPVWRCVVFVQRRTTAAALAELLDTLLAPEVPLRVGVQTGYSIGCSGSKSAQREVLRAFRRGDLNLLVATDVLEEGAGSLRACQQHARMFPKSHHPVLIFL